MAAVGHTPTRMCKVCRTKKPKAELTRWTKSDTGWFKDETKTVAGRGAYTCSAKCEEILLTKFGKK